MAPNRPCRKPSGLILHQSDELAQPQTQGPGDLRHVLQSEVPLAPLDVAHVSPINIREFCEPLLGDLSGLPPAPDGPAKSYLERIAFASCHFGELKPYRLKVRRI